MKHHTTFIFALWLGLWAAVGHAKTRFSDRVMERQLRYEKFAQAPMASHPSLEDRQANFKYMNNATMPYAVTSLPEVPYDIGEMYSGSIDIQSGNSTRTLFFVFYPKLGSAVEEITIWLNGGPGCSSLEGFFQENGPFVWEPGTLAPVQNPYSWVNLTNMLWVDQPVGTGFSTGTPTATTQEETAQDFISFFRNFQDLFGIKNYKIYVTGESYAGRYVPYIGAAMLDANDTTYYNLSGILVYDPVIGAFTTVQEDYVAVPFAASYNNILNINQSFLDTMQQRHQSCGFASYIDQYLQFPPPGPQPAANGSINQTCDTFDALYNAISEVNPCFDIYQIVQQCPLLTDVLAFPTALVENQYNTTYFNRTDVKTAMHAPQSIDWMECSGPVFVGRGGPEGEGDLSADPIQRVLPQVIEATNRVLVGNGDFDMIIITNGTLLAIQNMTWNGQLGFQSRPNTTIDIQIGDLQYASVYADNGDNSTGAPGPQGTMGIQHFERGLMWAETYQSGHMQPEFQPRVTYRHLQWLLGQIETI